MVKVIGVIVLLASIATASFWVYRLGAPKLTEQQAMRAAQYRADLSIGPESIATQAVLYPGHDVHRSTGGPFPIYSTGCPGWVIWFACPPRSIWVVRVHTPGKGNYDLLVDANTGGPP
jgi:hypothetical protein